MTSGGGERGILGCGHNRTTHKSHIIYLLHDTLYFRMVFSTGRHHHRLHRCGVCRTQRHHRTLGGRHGSLHASAKAHRRELKPHASGALHAAAHSDGRGEVHFSLGTLCDEITEHEVSVGPRTAHLMKMFVASEGGARKAPTMISFHK